MTIDRRLASHPRPTATVDPGASLRKAADPTQCMDRPPVDPMESE
jgi:hypothetical protein